MENQAGISVKNTPEDYNTGGESTRKTSSDEGEILHMCHGIEEISAAHQARLRGTTAQLCEINAGIEALEA